MRQFNEIINEWDEQRARSGWKVQVNERNIVNIWNKWWWREKSGRSGEGDEEEIETVTKSNILHMDLRAHLLYGTAKHDERDETKSAKKQFRAYVWWLKCQMKFKTCWLTYGIENMKYFSILSRPRSRPRFARRTAAASSEATMLCNCGIFPTVRSSLMPQVSWIPVNFPRKFLFYCSETCSNRLRLCFSFAARCLLQPYLIIINCIWFRSMCMAEQDCFVESSRT